MRSSKEIFFLKKSITETNKILENFWLDYQILTVTKDSDNENVNKFYIKFINFLPTVFKNSIKEFIKLNYLEENKSNIDDFELEYDIFEVKQKRYVISNQKIPTLGFIDLFNFEPLHRRAGVGILIIEKFRGKGLGKKALDLLISHSKKNLNINCLFANIAFENKASISLFKSSGFIKVGLKKSWNFYHNSFHDEYLYQKLLS